MKTNRRDFVRRWGTLLGSAAVTGPWHSLLARYAHGETSGLAEGFGPLQPCIDETTGLALIKLPAGFRCISFGWTSDLMADGRLTPPYHDGMGAFESASGNVVLCRNHEVDPGSTAFGDPASSYDPHGGGGCTRLSFNPTTEKWLESRVCLSGTLRNCAGGTTPWQSWLSCEETVLGPGDVQSGHPLFLEQTHGWIFETIMEADIAASQPPQPLRDMGRFVHEAVAVDDETGIVYETEDRLTAGFYRFIPNVARQLHRGGRLQMLLVIGASDLRDGIGKDAIFDVQWVDIEDPQRPHSPGTDDNLGVFHQGKARDAATFTRLEGIWYEGETVYFVSTNGGDAGCGQVWAYHPAEEQLRLVFESPDPAVVKMPDNITVSPRGAIVLCEDGKKSGQRLQGLTTDGRIFPFGANNVVLNGERNGLSGDFRDGEWAGVTFSPDGKWLFANLQNPGITLAITGPWDEGLL